MNTLFYSNYCQYSNNLIKTLKSNNLLHTFSNIICIDDIPTDKIPEYLKTVPTIIVSDYDKPLEYKNAISWIRFQNENHEQNKEQIQTKQENNKPPEVIHESKKGELNNAAFMGIQHQDTNMTDFELLDGDNGKNECFLDNMFSIMNAEPVNEMGGKLQENDNNFDQRLEQIQKLRDMDNKFIEANNSRI